MDELRMLADALDGTETPASQVRLAMRRLRGALDDLQASLEAFDRPIAAGQLPATTEIPALWLPAHAEHDASTRHEPPPLWVEASPHPGAIETAEAPQTVQTTPAIPLTQGGMTEPWSWPSGPASASPVRHPGPTPEPALQPPPPVPEISQPGSSDWGQWTTSDAMREGGWPGGASQTSMTPVGVPPATEAADAESAEVRDQVRRAVEQLKAEIAAGLDTTAEAQIDPTPSVEQTPAPSSPAPTLTSAAEVRDVAQSDLEDIREQVRHAVLEAKAEIEAGEAPAAAASRDTLPTTDAVRDQVRRAVEEAKADLAVDRSPPVPAFPEVQRLEEMRIPHYEALLDERFLAPASLVIEDPEGRVELVRVYRTLAKLECAATANLANYSSHSVTVQLEERKLPSAADIEASIVYAFERQCVLDIDGNRANIRLFSSKTRAA